MESTSLFSAAQRGCRKSLIWRPFQQQTSSGKPACTDEQRWYDLDLHRHQEPSWFRSKRTLMHIRPLSCSEVWNHYCKSALYRVLPLCSVASLAKHTCDSTFWPLHSPKLRIQNQFRAVPVFSGWWGRWMLLQHKKASPLEELSSINHTGEESLRD